MSLRRNVLSDSAAYVTVLDKHCERNASAGQAFQPVLIPAMLLLPRLSEKQARYCRNAPTVTIYRHCPLSFYYRFGRFCMFPHLPGMHKRCVRRAKFWMVWFTDCLFPAGRNDGEVRLARFMDELTSAGLGCCVANVWVAGQRFGPLGEDRRKPVRKIRLLISD